MSTFPLVFARRFRPLSLMLLLLGLLSPRMVAAKTLAPVTSSLQVLTSPTLGGSCRVIWAGVPDITPQSAELGFKVIAPDGSATITTQSITLTQGRATDATYTFRTPLPGTYQVLARVVLNVSNGRFVQLAELRVALPAAGRAYLTRERTLTARQFAAQAYTKAPAIIDTRPKKTTSSPGFTIRGTFNYTKKTVDINENTSTALTPIRKATVMIYEADGKTTLTLGSVLTSSSGAFTFSVPPATVTGFGRNFLVQLWSESPVGAVHDLLGAPYLYSIPVAQWQGGTLDLGTLNLGLDQSGPWNIYNCLITGSDYTHALTGNEPFQCKVIWAKGYDVGTGFDHISNTINVQGTAYDPDEFDDPVLLHEYGHFVSANFAYDKNPGGTHYWTSHIGPQLAWSEGWANFFSSAVRNSQYYIDGSIWGVMVFDLELPTSYVTGDDNEGAVAGSLWDIFDSHNDGRDQLSGGIVDIWFVMSHYFSQSRRCVFRDFYDGWIALGRAHLAEVQNIMLEHGIQYPQIAVTSFKINNGAATTLSPTVTLNNTCLGSPTAYMASENDGFTGASWKVYSTAPSYTLPAGRAIRGIYFKVKDAAGNESSPMIATIAMGTVPITPITIDGPKLTGLVLNEFDYNLYSFTVSQAGSYVIDTGAGTLDDTVIWLYGPNSQTTLIEANDDGHGGADYMSRIALTLEPGSYTLMVKGFATLIGDYTVWVASGTPAAAIPRLEVDGPALKGNIDYSAEIRENWFQVYIPAPGPYTIETGAGTLTDTQISLYGPGNKTALVATDDDGGKSYMSVISRNFTPGLYYIKVIAFTPLIHGDYTIRAYPGLRGANTPLAINAPAVSDTISSSTDFNWFTFTVTVPGSYAIETTAGSLTNDQLYFYGPNSRANFIIQRIKSTSGGMAALAIDLDPGVYYFKVEGYQDSDIGSYGVRVRTDLHAAPLAASGAWARSNVSASMRFNWFQFTVTTPTAYTLQTAAGSLTDTVLSLFGPNDPLKLYAQSDDITTKNHMSQLTVFLAPGTYHALVEGYSAADEGDYLIRLVPIPMAPSTPLTINGDPFMAAISLSWDVDWYSFRVSRTGTYIIESLSGTIQADYLRLYGPDNQAILVGQGGSATSTGRIMAQLNPGMYYVRVQGFSAADLGSYTIQVREEVATLIADGATTRGAINAGWDSRWYRFTIPAAGAYTIETSAGTLSDSYLRLFGPNSRDALLAWDNDSGAGKMAAITRILTPGTYYIKVQGYQATDLGTFWVNVHRTITPLTVDAPAAGAEIAMAGDLNWFSFNVVKTDTYTIETTAGTLSDNYLRLYGPYNRTTLIAQDDNSGQGKMAKIKARLRPGTYYVMANGRTADNLGTYQVKVSR